MDARQFFEAYGRSFKDTAADVAKFYAVPCITARGGVARLNTTAQDVEEFFGPVLQRYRQQGFVDGRIKSMETRELGANSMLVTIEWDYLGEQREVLWSWTFTYNLYTTREGLKIILQTKHD